jgi:hypothetical protein
MMQDGYTRYFDVVSFCAHPDRKSLSPENNDFEVLVDAVRGIMRRHGIISKELWVCEAGWPSCPGGVDEMRQANYLVRCLTVSLAQKALKFFWPNLHDLEPLAWKGSWKTHLGLLDSNSRPKPAAAAYQLATFMMCQTEFRERSRQGKALIYSFDIRTHSRKWPGVMHVTWTPEPDSEEQIELPATGSGQMFAIDYLGAERPGVRSSAFPRGSVSEADMHTSGTTAQDQPGSAPLTYRFRVTNEPLYIWDVGAPPTGSRNPR